MPIARTPSPTARRCAPIAPATAATPSGLAPVDLTLDTSLRPGDVVATTDGLVAFTGVRLGASQTADFTPVASFPGLTADVRARLGEMKVAPMTAEMVANDAAAPMASRDVALPTTRRPKAMPRQAGEARPKRSLAVNRAQRPTMTPITFGADRYFSSICARAAARFSGVSRPRFSARIIQQ